jgi:hypothetical protein
MDKRKLRVTGTDFLKMGKSTPLPKPDGEPYNVKKLRQEVAKRQSETYEDRRKK